MTKQTMDAKVIREILDAPIPFSNEEEEATCLKMIGELNKEDVEVAARISYAYWVASTTPELRAELVNDEITTRVAMREARRQLVGQSHKLATAMEHLQNSIAFRNEYNVDALRSCFDDYEQDDAETKKLKGHYRQQLTKELENQLNVVRGHDKENCAIVIKQIRTKPDMDPEAYLLSQIYVGERAFACTEYLTRGKHERIVAVYEFANYSSKNSPGSSNLIKTATKLQSVYAERLKKLVILDPTFWMRGIYNLAYPFLSAATASKVSLVSSTSAKQQALEGLIAPEHATPAMLPNGKLTTPVNVKRMLQDVPFHCAYDDIIES